MPPALNVLVVEDRPADFRLLERHLRKWQPATHCRCVISAAELGVSLAEGPWDLVLSDYNLPNLDFLEILELVRKRDPDLPLILVSGSVGEERAVELLKLGVWDFVLKDGLTRLVPAIERGLRDRVQRRQRRDAEEALRESEARLRTLGDNLPGGALYQLLAPPDGRNRYLHFSAGIERIFGLTAEQVMRDPQPFWDLILAEDRPHLDAAQERSARELAPFDCEFRQRTVTGEVKWLHARSVPRRLEDGSILWDGVVIDITREVELEAQFRQAQKMEAIGQLAGGVAHDFNNILAAIVMQAELGADIEGSPVAAQSSFEEIRAAAERAATLTRQLLLFGRRQVMQPRILDLNAAVTQLASMLRRILGEDIRLHLNLHARPLWTSVDAGMLDQMLLNLSVNARDAMPNGGNLTIETMERTLDAVQAWAHPGAVPGRYVGFSVRDEGCGIPPEVRPRIFEPFFTTKEAGKGTGLGLATVFGIVEQHHGWIDVESEPGRGAMFLVCLSASPPPPAKDPAATAPRPRGGSEAILLVEDEPGVRIVLGTHLRRNGYQVVEAASGPAALELAAEPGRRIDLLLTDLVLPDGIDGRELAAQVLRARPQLKVIFTSGYSSELAGRLLSLQPGQMFLQKPCPAAKVLESVRTCLDG